MTDAPFLDYHDEREALALALDAMVDVATRAKAAIAADTGPACAASFNLQLKDTPATEAFTFEWLTGEKARTLAAGAITAFEFQDTQDQQAVLRCPGLVAVSAKTLALLGELNTAKERFAVQSAKFSFGAFKQTRKRDPRFTRLARRQARRTLTLLNETPTSVAFWWHMSNVSSTCMTAATAIKFVESQAQSPLSNMSKRDWHTYVFAAVNKLKELHEKRSVYRYYTTPPTVSSQVNYMEHRDTPSHTTLPIFYDVDLARREPAVTKLPPCSGPRETRRPLWLDEFLPELNLYLPNEESRNQREAFRVRPVWNAAQGLVLKATKGAKTLCTLPAKAADLRESLAELLLADVSASHPRHTRDGARWELARTGLTMLMLTVKKGHAESEAYKFSTTEARELFHALIA